jgi:hypothetical protein
MNYIHCGPLISCPLDLNFLHSSDYVRRAGVIPYMVHNGVTYILLGYSNEKNPVWADLGGRSEEDETTLQTALREYGEESRYVLPIDLSRLSKILITGRSGSIYPDQVLLLVEVDPIYHNINDKFQQTIPRTPYEDEMSLLKWIPYEEFMKMSGLTYSMEDVRNLLKSI